MESYMLKIVMIVFAAVAFWSGTVNAQQKYPNVPPGIFRDGLLADDKGDYATALKNYKIAGGQGNLVALMNVGYYFETGKGVKKDYPEAARWYKLASEGGYAAASARLAEMHKIGEGVEQSNTEYVRLLRLASAQGDSRSTNLLRSMN